MLGNTNIIALVGAGESPEFSHKRLILWDAKNQKKVCEIYFEEEKILNVKLNFSMLAVATRKNCYIYHFPKIRHAKTICCYNPSGLIAISSNVDFNYFTYVNRNTNNEEKIEDSLAISYIPDLLQAKETNIANWSNESDISCLSFNYTGNLMAAASSQGKYIHILKVPSLTKIITLHRGIDATTIYQLSFSRESNYLLNTSEKGTLHIYDISSVVKSENDIGLNGGFNLTKVAHGLFHGAKHLVTGKSEDINYSIITYDYARKSKTKFIATFSQSNKLIYLIDEQGQFTELRITENQIKADSIRADDILKVSSKS